MSAVPPESATPAHAPRRPAVWPWLLVPLVTLAIFFLLRNLRQAPPQDVISETQGNGAQVRESESVPPAPEAAPQP